MSNHSWVTFSKGRINITGCARCGQILLPTNEESACHKIPMTENILYQKGNRVIGSSPNSEVA